MDRVAQTDQASMDAKNTARILAAFYCELREAEVDEEMRRILMTIYAQKLLRN